MEALLMTQEETMQRLIKSYSNYKKTPRQRLTASYIDAKCEILEKMWNGFTEIHVQIVGSVKREDKSNVSYFKEDHMGQFEETFVEYKSRMKEDLLKLLNESSANVHTGRLEAVQSTSCCEVKLPQIHLPKFGGGYEEWQTFHDLFQSLIHSNKKLSAVQKLHYLKTSLTGEPETLLKNLSTTETNYDEAWKQLTRRYNNKRYNCNEIMKRLFTQKAIQTESAVATKHLLDTTAALLKSLSNVGIDTSSWDPVIIYLVVSKLDTESRKQWEMHVSQRQSEDLPTWDNLTSFLENRFRTLEMIDSSNKSSVKSVSYVKPNVSTFKAKSFHSSIEENKNYKVTCVMCSENHSLHQCKQFGTQSPELRTEFVQSNRLCFNCLSPAHPVKQCHNSSSCRRCGKRHHTMLHYERGITQGTSSGVSSNNESVPRTGDNPSLNNNSEPRITSHFVESSFNSNHTLLATAVVKADSVDGTTQFVRALVDQGSEASFVTEATVQNLGLKRTTTNGIVSGIGDGRTRVKGVVSMTLRSVHQPYEIKVEAFVLSTLTSFLPSTKAEISDWPTIDNIPLADPEYDLPRKVDIILGVEVHNEILKAGILSHPSVASLIAQNTQFGWIISGRIKRVLEANTNIVNLHIKMSEDELLTRFWEIEREPDVLEKKLTREEQRCEEIFNDTTMRDRDGRYIVRLPFRDREPESINGKSRDIAFRRFRMLEKRLMRNPSLYEEYKCVIDGYLNQNHMVQITQADEIHKPDVVYLPHHPVVREDKETSKVRIVFDASAKGVNGASLNSDLIVGPKLQQDLRHILMRWRRHPICIVADLVQMYRQVLVSEEDSDRYQRILWRADLNEPIQHYKLLRVTFGTACAPYLAVKVLQQLAKDEMVNVLVASKIAIEDFYMDDMLTGCENVHEAKEIYEQMTKLMTSGGFTLQKWGSNSKDLIEHIEQDNRQSEKSLVFKVNDTIKVLGICWNRESDNFEYTLQMPESVESSPVTKRKVLSEIASLYDPMGWIAPVLICAKIFIQKIWKSGLSWDEQLTPELLRDWLMFRADLYNVKRIVIPRWLEAKRDDEVELHVFADASQAAYAAAVYIKFTNEVGESKVNLFTAKTKVAPIAKEISIPRLELCAALLAAKLIFEVAQVMNVPKDKLHAWSDSTVVLAWLQGEPSRWNTFVSNRVSEILTMLDKEQWSHVSTDRNPADCASRGISVRDLTDHQLWWHGPVMLRVSQYRETTKSDINFSTEEEMRPIKVLSARVAIQEDFVWLRFSKLQKALRVLSFCRKFMCLLPNRDKTILNKSLSAEEIANTLEQCIRETQVLYYEKEIKCLRANQCVCRSSVLATLSPFLDRNGILRVGGRIQQAHVEFDTKHPIILPGECYLTKLIIQDSHEKTLHGGPQIMLNYLRSKFWIIRVREKVKSIYRECRVCLRYSKQNQNQLMGQLPESRLKPSKPFLSSGVDFTGFINIRFSPGRGSKSFKGYICVFVCMCTKAIHLEAVSDLTSQGFIAAFQRFVSRRGRCRELFSDNGTNFVGAEKELRNMFNVAVSELPIEISQLLANDGTTWSFIPPHAPNFGGLWEAGVRMAKSHLKRVIGETTLTFEELSTVLTQVEACLNSRPISYLSDSPDDPLPLTPGHFLVGEPLIVVPDEDYSITNISPTQRWKLTRKMINDFWRKWSKEYLVTLNQRFKWRAKRDEPMIDDVVVIKDFNMPPAKWLLGRVIEKHPGKDNITRVVTLKTKNGVFKRPCNKLCFLSTQSSE